MGWLRNIFGGCSGNSKKITVEELCIGDRISGIGVVDSKYRIGGNKWRIWIKCKVNWLDIEAGQMVKVDE